MPQQAEENDGRNLQRMARKTYGEAEYARRNEAKQAVIRALFDKTMVLVEEARERGFVYFACHLDVSVRNTPIRLLFADGQGVYYQRSLGIKQLSLKHALVPTLADATDIKIAVQSYVLTYDGIKPQSRGMTARRSRPDSAGI